jgi:isobutyryl-CoA mutase
MAIPVRRVVPAVGEAARTPLRLLTATSLFDGHDAAINVIRRLIQDHGAEVVHLGHNRSVEEIVRAALQEDVDGIAVSSYQGGHMEFFRYLLARLREEEAADIPVFGGGGATITPEEARALEACGVIRVYTAVEGLAHGLDGMVEDLMGRTRAARVSAQEARGAGDPRYVARILTRLERGLTVSEASAPGASAPVIGITGTGGSGKSSLIDELVSRFLRAFPALEIALLAIDPTRHRSGGALLGDRIRINSLASPRVYMRSMATRRRHRATAATLEGCIAALRRLGFGLVLVETAGSGQADSEIAELADLAVYVMTSDYGAPTQLEKIEMLDYADVVVLNKCDKPGAEDALREVRKQWRRNHKAFDPPDAELPIHAVRANRFNDAGVEALFGALCRHLAELSGDPARWWCHSSPALAASAEGPPIPPARARYLGEISEQGRAMNAATEREARAASLAQALYRGLQALGDAELPGPLAAYPHECLDTAGDPAVLALRHRYQEALGTLSEESVALLRGWPERRARAQAERYAYTVRGREVSGATHTRTLSHLRIPKVAVPRYEDWGERLRFLRQENLPGAYPYTAGVYPYRHTAEEPTRMFAGEGMPERTNRRFHYLAAGQPSARLSTAFDPVTLYGEDPAVSPDVLGCIGMSGVSTATLDDVKRLYSGFDLADPRTSVSLTINGPAPVLLACFLNAAIDQQVEKYLRAIGRWEAARHSIAARFGDHPRPAYRAPLPPGHDGLGLGLLGVSGEELVECEVYDRIRRDTLARIRGTVQADILKEDQAQNECIFSVEFGLRAMADVQAYCIVNRMRQYYSVSVSGYHIAEAGANPITQLAFTLANAFTLVEYFLARGMHIDDFAPQMSFFFSNGMDPEYAVLGRVARRVWARALRERYRANPRSQMLKYHVQTSGRSLHSRDIAFNDIRTTLEALYAVLDNCNSLHTNAYDEAVTTPTEESVRRALAIQLIINRELGLNANQNPLQGSFFIEQLTDQVEEAVYREFERLAARGGVLGAMETLYQRARIQEESLHYEQRKHGGELPIVGVNTFLAPDAADTGRRLLLTRATDAERRAQLAGVQQFRELHAAQAPAALARLQTVAHSGGNLFAELMHTVRVCTLGQITHALYEVGGRYRRAM